MSWDKLANTVKNYEKDIENGFIPTYEKPFWDEEQFYPISIGMYLPCEILSILRQRAKSRNISIDNIVREIIFEVLAQQAVENILLEESKL